GRGPLRRGSGGQRRFPGAEGGTPVDVGREAGSDGPFASRRQGADWIISSGERKGGGGGSCGGVRGRVPRSPLGCTEHQPSGLGAERATPFHPRRYRRSGTFGAIPPPTNGSPGCPHVHVPG
ncbi:unnamed protein product, partial [Ectocarpus sp. 12 AP-2014]